MQSPCHSKKTAMNVLQVFLKLHKKDPTGRTEFDWFVDGFFERYPPEKNSMPLKRFLYSSRRRVRQKASRHFQNYLRRISVEIEMAA